VLPHEAAAPLWAPPPKAGIDPQLRLAFFYRCALRSRLAACFPDFDFIVGDFFCRPNRSRLPASLHVLVYVMLLFYIAWLFCVLIHFSMLLSLEESNITAQPEGGDILGNAGKIHSGYFLHRSCGTIVLDLSFQLNRENRREKRKARHISGKTRF